MGPNHRAIERELAARQRAEEEAREAALAPERDRAMAAIAIWNADLAAGKAPFYSPTIGAARMQPLSMLENLAFLRKLSSA